MATDLMNISVRIYGWDYVLKVDPSQSERAKAIAEYLDQRMHQIAGKASAPDTIKIAIRAALTIVDELFEAQNQINSLQSLAGSPVREEMEVTEKLEELTRRIDMELESL